MTLELRHACLGFVVLAMRESSFTATSARVPAAPPFAWLAGLAFVTVFAAFGWTIDGHFVGDDFAYVGRYAEWPLAEWPSLFTRGWVDGLFDPPVRELRPLTALTYIIDAKLWGASPLGFRVTNLVLHALTATMVGLLAWRVAGRDRGCALVATALFALHPVHAEPVTWITGRNDVLTALFMLGTLGVFIRYRRVRSNGWLLTIATLQACALFAREAGIIVPLVLLATDLVWLRPGNPCQRAVWLPYAACAVVLLFYFACRHVAFAVGALDSVGAGLPDFTRVETYLSFARHQIGHLCHLLPPLDVAVLPWRESDPIGRSEWLRLAAIGTGVALPFTLLLWRGWRGNATAEQRHVLLLFGPAWLLVTLAPLVMTYFSPRHLYPTVAGFALFVALLLRGAIRSRVVFAGVGAFLIAVNGALLVQRTRPWHDAALLSGRISAALTELERAPETGPLFLDVPGHPDHTQCWAWAVPHATRPPFLTTDLGARRPMLATPSVHAYAGNWNDPQLLARVAQSDTPGWLFQCDDDGSLLRTAIPPEKYRAALAVLRSPAPSEPSMAWRRFVLKLTP